ncbi:hypothetical protein ACEPAF_4365 [Sanghuangporus sanghuang]
MGLDGCKRGKYELCESLIVAFAFPIDGTLQRYHSYPFDTFYTLPDHLTLEDGAMLEPLSVAVHAVSNVGQFRHGRNVLVFGAGPMGLLCMAVARVLGRRYIRSGWNWSRKCANPRANHGSLIAKEPKVTGSIVYCPGDYQLALALASSGKVDLKPLVTHRFRFEDAVTAFEVTRARKSIDERGQTKDVIKTIILGPDVNPLDL